MVIMGPNVWFDFNLGASKFYGAMNQVFHIATPAPPRRTHEYAGARLLTLQVKDMAGEPKITTQWMSGFCEHFMVV